METVKSWAISICMASLAGTVAHFLSPSGSTQRIFKVVISVFFITVMVYPIVGLSGDSIGDLIDGYTYNDAYVDNTEQIAEIVLKQSVFQIKNSVGEILDKLEIKGYEISVNTDIDESESIVISSIEIMLGEEYRAKVQEICAELRKNIDCKIDVYVGGTVNGEG